MATEKEHNISDEDIPSDFFDDFNKDEFMDGLSVIDSWDDSEGNKRRIDADAVHSVDDLRELIRDDCEEKSYRSRPMKKFDSKYKWVRKRDSRGHSKSDERKSSSRIDECTKPGSRRDPNKTNQAIKKDKEIKVKEYLAKRLDSSDELKPPGTELDDFYEKRKEVTCDNEEYVNYKKKKRSEKYNELVRKKYTKVLPDRYYRPHHPEHRSPRWSPVHSHWSPARISRRSSPQSSSQWKFKRSGHRSPNRHYSRHRSPIYRSPHRSHYSRSPNRSYHSRKSRSLSAKRDSFLYPTEPQPSYSADTYSNVSRYSYTVPTTDFASAPLVTYMSSDSYSGTYSGPYEYGTQGMPAGPIIVPAPYAAQPETHHVAAPVLESPGINVPHAAPAMVPPPTPVAPIGEVSTNSMTSSTSNALAKLVAEGKLSQQDYLKLTPNKGANPPMDTKTRVVVLNRCHQALSKLSKLMLPNRLIISNNIVGNETKSIAPKYCSPLKRQARVEFEMTKLVDGASKQNKQLVDSIIASIGLEKVVARPKKKATRNIKDASTQTSRPFCDVCEIRESTKLYDAGTSIDSEHFQLSAHTQVDEQDLVSSKAMFNPSGSIGDSGPISIAHLTPAQLVSQLAARAKTLKQSDPPPAPSAFSRRNASTSYNNYDPRGGNPYNYNYRY